MREQINKKQRRTRILNLQHTNKTMRIGRTVRKRSGIRVRYAETNSWGLTRRFFRDDTKRSGLGMCLARQNVIRQGARAFYNRWQNIPILAVLILITA